MSAMVHGRRRHPATQGDYVANGYSQNENAIARWDVVPYQTFTGNFNVGVVAFATVLGGNQLDHVAFAVNGGAWVNVSAMTANPQTVNTSEAWASIMMPRAKELITTAWWNTGDAPGQRLFHR